MADNQSPAKGLAAKVRALYGVGDFGFTLMSNVETFYFNTFLTNVAMFTPALAGTIATITSVIDAALSWVYGVILDSAKPMKWGRYRSWLLILPWIVPFLFAFQFVKFSDNVGVSATLIIVAFVISHFVWNIPWTANVTLVSVMGKTPEARAQLASSRGTWNNFSGVIFSYIYPTAAAIAAGIIGEQNQIAGAAFILGVFMAFTYFVHFKISDGLEEIEDASASAKQRKPRASFKDMLQGLGQNPNLIFLIIADIPKWMVRFVVSGSAIYYFRDVAGRMDLFTIPYPNIAFTYILVSGCMGVIGAYVAGVLAKMVTGRTMFLFSLFSMAALTLISYFSYQSPWTVLILMSLAQIPFGCAYSVTPALYADTAIYSKWKTGKDTQGWVMGLQTVPLKVAIILRGVVLNAALAAVGYIAPKLENGAVVNADVAYNFATATDSAKQGIASPFTLIPAIFLIAGGLIFMFGYKLSKEKVLQYQNEINAREKK